MMVVVAAIINSKFVGLYCPWLSGSDCQLSENFREKRCQYVSQHIQIRISVKHHCLLQYIWFSSWANMNTWA
jgi:hypothetical protein